MDILTRASDAVEHYLDALDEMQRITDLLLHCLKDWDESRVATLMDARSDLCLKIREHSNNLVMSAREVDPGDKTWMETVERVRQTERKVFGMQLESESVLAAQIETCRAEAARETNLKSAASIYSRPDRGYEARFLDSRL